MSSPRQPAGPSTSSLPSARQLQERNVIATKLCFLTLVTTVFMAVLCLRFLARGGGEPPELVRASQLACPACSPCNHPGNASILAGDTSKQPQQQLLAAAQEVAERPHHRRRRRHDPNTLPQQLYQAVHQDPSLAGDPAVAAAFLPTPWLLPEAAATQENLPYLGLHNDLEGLLRVRAGPVGGKDAEARGVSVVYFSGSHAVMMQNFVYTAVKWAGITNYMVATWGDASLAACIAMHLPCFNATAFSPLPAEEGEATFQGKGFAAVTWIKPRLAHAIVSRGYHVHSSDVDIAFPPKALWPSMMRFLEGPGADVAMERDLWGPINTGCVVVRPTEYGRAFMEAWQASAREDSLAGLNDQERAMQLGPSVFRTCEGPWDCARMAAERAEQARLAQQYPGNGTEVPRWALLRRYHPAWDMLWQDHCAALHTQWAAPIDPCMPPNPPYHAVCVTGSFAKIQGFKATGLWFLDEEGTEGCTKPPEGQGEGADGADQAAVRDYAARFIARAAAEREGEQGVTGSQQGQGQGQEPHPGPQQGQVEGAGSAGSAQRRALQKEQQQPQESQQDPQQPQQEQILQPRAEQQAQPQAEQQLPQEQGQGQQPQPAQEAPQQEQPQPQQLQQEQLPPQQPEDQPKGQHEEQQHPQQQGAAVARCRPLAWRQPRAEASFLHCDKSQLAWVSYPPDDSDDDYSWQP
ncbi:hypothetical protein N2152v2_000817 [Parachlorella kessleri]